MSNGKFAQILLLLLIIAEIFVAIKTKKIEKKHIHRHSKREVIPICVDFTRSPVECPKKFKKLKLDRLVMQQLNTPSRRISLRCYLNMLPSPYCFRRNSKLF